MVRAIEEYDRLGPEAFFAAHGFAPTTTYDLHWELRRYPPKAILGTAYEFATGNRLASGDFEAARAAPSRCSASSGLPCKPADAADVVLARIARGISATWSTVVSNLAI